jgi:predicted RNA-binding protein with PIN domain
MRWLIDGYNVVRSDPALRTQEATSLETGRRGLLHLVARLARGSRDDFTVVFDGARRAETLSGTGRVSVVFSRAPETADQVVIRLAERFRNGAVVVTSDRTVADAARRAGCSVIGAATFAERARAGASPRDSVAGTRPADDRASSHAGVGEKDDDADERPARKGGNPRRPSKKARAAIRALRRLPPS